MITRTNIIRETIEHFCDSGDVDNFAWGQARDKGKGHVEEGGCRYRTRDGKACAVGRYIPDTVYDPIIEGARAEAVLMKVTRLIDNKPTSVFVHPQIANAIPLSHDPQFWRRLQRAHDYAASRCSESLKWRQNYLRNRLREMMADAEQADKQDALVRRS